MKVYWEGSHIHYSYTGACGKIIERTGWLSIDRLLPFLSNCYCEENPVAIYILSPQDQDKDPCLCFGRDLLED